MAAYTDLVNETRKHQRSLDRADLDWRRDQLRALQRMIRENQPALLDALHKDLRVAPQEGKLLQLGVINAEIKHALKHLDEWAAPEKVRTPLHLQPAKSSVAQEPLGTVLIMGAWNYPLLLTLSPLVGAIAAGNAAVIKPSEMAPATAQVLADLLPRYLDPKAFPVVQGGVPETTELLKERFDLVFFTGSANVGKIVMRAAAEHLTPVVLELGGQSPCIVDKSADLKTAALRIVFAKFANAGQTCVAPNHIFVHKEVATEFTKVLKETLEKFYGSDPQKSPDFARIVSRKHVERLKGLMDGQTIAHGGQVDADDLYVAPTILTGVDPKSPVMQEEIFGPVLPIMEFENIDDVFNDIASRPHPLAAYVFATDKDVIERAKKEISAGGICANNAMMHLAVDDLPFGGGGEGSGFGAYHGRAGFDVFSRRKSILQSANVEPGLHYPPYGRKIRELILKGLGLTP
ncbi:MAG TPA: aldehyde dehydrogenase family protein [Patescibacteria group bacterium]|nr:aldehyde dehydrogenase family protein [Patescibacteria group bacterium]